MRYFFLFFLIGISVIVIWYVFGREENVIWLIFDFKCDEFVDFGINKYFEIYML